MCKLLHFPSPGKNSSPEPPVPSMGMPRPVEPIMTNAVSTHVISMPAPDSRPRILTKSRIVA